MSASRYEALALTLLAILALGARGLGGESKGQSLTRAALEQRLAEEKARLARLKAQLEAIRKGEAAPEQTESPKATKPADNKQKVSAEKKPSETKSPLERRPQLGAADALYRLGRYAEARKVYRAVAAAKDTPVPDRIWALLQAGNCSRRLGEFDDAIEQFQLILAQFKDKPWFKSHVEWALRAAQWEKRWQRAAEGAGE